MTIYTAQLAATEAALRGKLNLAALTPKQRERVLGNISAFMAVERVSGGAVSADCSVSVSRSLQTALALSVDLDIAEGQLGNNSAEAETRDFEALRHLRVLTGAIHLDLASPD